MDRRHEQTFLQRRHTNSHRHMKKCSTSLGIREIQFQTTMRYHFTPVTMAKINKSVNDRCWWGYREKRTLLHCWWECKLVQPFWKTVRKFLRKLEIEITYNSAIALLGIYPKDSKIQIWRSTFIPMFIAALSTIAKLWKEPRYPSTDEWIKKMWHIYHRILAIKKNEILPFVTMWIELECFISKIS